MTPVEKDVFLREALARAIDPLRPVWSYERDGKLICRAIHAETHDVKTFVFTPKHPARIAFAPGQFMTFSFDIDGEEVQRCYTISSSAAIDASISITVKLNPGGKVSPWLHKELKVGNRVKAEGPNGLFTPEAVGGQEKFLFLSGGSGITPLISMTRTFADLAEDRDIIFIHGARSPRDVLLGRELDRLAIRLPRLKVVQVVESRDGEPGWPGYVGRIDAALLAIVAPDLATRSVLSCGPAPFMQAMKTLADKAGVPAANYAEESFSLDVIDVPSGPATAAASRQVFDITFAKSNRVFPCDSGTTILEAARRAGVPLASGCAKGLCGTCKSRKISGQVDMKHTGGIRQREVDQGLFLPCCSRPLENVIIDR